jgi:uncharacterized protein (TIGR02996 family)
MTDRDALLRAIAVNPDDDTPRLIYADLLDELGGAANTARAQFIRVQIDLARRPGRSWFANSDRLCEVSRLAGEFADKWLDELPEWAADEARKQRLRADDFPRGFLETFHVRLATFVLKGNELLDAAPVTRVVVPPLTAPYDLTALFVSPFLLRVRALALPGASRDTALFVKTSRVLSALEELNLSGSAMTDARAGALTEALTLGSLKTLLVRDSGLTAAGAARLLAAPKLPALQTIDLRGTSGVYQWAGWLRQRFPKKTVLT